MRSVSVSALDTQHRAICEQLSDWYRGHGDEELSFVAVCKAILARREAEDRLYPSQCKNWPAGSAYRVVTKNSKRVAFIS